MALSQAAIKRNRKANKRAKIKTRFFPSAGPSREEIEKLEKSRKNKKAAIKSAQIEAAIEIDKLGKDLERAKTVRGKDIIIAKFMKKAEAQKEMNKRGRDKYQKQRDQAARDAIATTAGIKKYAKGGGIRKANYK